MSADGGAVLQQRHYHNFKQFRIFDLSDHKMTSQHLIVSRACARWAALAACPGSTHPLYASLGCGWMETGYRGMCAAGPQQR